MVLSTAKELKLVFNYKKSLEVLLLPLITFNYECNYKSSFLFGWSLLGPEAVTPCSQRESHALLAERGSSPTVPTGAPAEHEVPRACKQGEEEEEEGSVTSSPTRSPRFYSTDFNGFLQTLAAGAQNQGYGDRSIDVKYILRSLKDGDDNVISHYEANQSLESSLPQRLLVWDEP